MNKQVMDYRFKMKDAMTAKEHCDCGEGSEVVEFEKKVRQVEMLFKLNEQSQKNYMVLFETGKPLTSN
jgi:hypothetical protein